MLTLDQINFYNSSGYVIVKNGFLKAEVLDVLLRSRSIFRKQAELHKVKYTPERPDEMILELWEKSPNAVRNCKVIIQRMLRAYEFQSRYLVEIKLRSLGIMNSIAARPQEIQVDSKNIVDVRVKIPPQRDWYSLQTSRNSVGLWIPLVDTPEILGSLQIIPTSHLREANFGGFDYSYGVELNCKEEEFTPLNGIEAGDIVLYNSMLITRFGQNKTEDRIRWSMNFWYSDLDDEEWISREYYSTFGISQELNDIGI